MAGGLAEAKPTGNLKGVLVGVDLVVVPVVEAHPHPLDWVSGQWPVLHGALDAALNGRNELLRDDPTLNLVLEYQAALFFLLLRNWADVHVDLGKLAAPSRLLLQDVVLVDHVGERLPVGDLGLADVGLHLELLLEPVDNNLEVKLPHSRNDRLPRFLVGTDVERRVLLGELRKAVGQLVPVGLGFGLDRNPNDRLREVHGLEHDRMVRVTDRVSGLEVLRTDHGGDVPGADHVHVLPAIGMHEHHAPDALVLVPGGAVNAGPRLQRAAVDADERQLPDVRVRRDLERDRAEGLVLPRMAGDVLLLVLRVVARNGGHVVRARKVVRNPVEHALHARVLEGRAAEHRRHVAVERRLPDHRVQLLGLHLLVLIEVLHEQLVVVLRDALQKVNAPVLGLRLQVVRNLPNVPLHALGLVVVDNGLAFDEVDDPSKHVARPDGILHRNRIGAEAVLHHLEDVFEVRPRSVHLVHEPDPRHVVLLGLAPDRLRLRLHAPNRTEQGNRPVQHAEGPLHLDRKVDVARRVDDVDPVVIPVAGGGRRGDGDAPLLLLLHEVHGRGPLVHLPHPVQPPGIKENALREGGLPGINVGHDADISGLLQREALVCLRSHGYKAQSWVLERSAQTGWRPDPSSKSRTGSERRPCWTRPCGACRPSSLRHRLRRERHRPAHSQGDSPCFSRSGPGRTE
ncbi:Translation elongation factor G (EF-G) [Salinibacter ruber M8]|uniref:Translation elongation factor G (EF-G) n=1 Tax=Salinibacter ruber (strain M8) TaxID=761659 RepID=D5H7Z8_SALRM|nr:Translation elongation factor G (EF-G) [Salinibacter ruber M8]